MNLDRRKFIIRSIGAAICAGLAPRFMPSLIPDLVHPGAVPFKVDDRMIDRMMAAFNSMGASGAGPSTIYMSHKNYEALVDHLGEQIRYTKYSPQNPKGSVAVLNGANVIDMGSGIDDRKLVAVSQSASTDWHANYWSDPAQETHTVYYI